MIAKLTITLITVFLCKLSIAGERGYAILVSDLSSTNGSKIFAEYRENFDNKNANEACWRARKGNGITYAYYKKPVAGFNRALFEKAISNDQASIETLRKKLKTFTDDQLGSGFDGALIISKDASRIYAIGTTNGFATKNLPVDYLKSKNLTKLDETICKLLSTLDNGFTQ